MDTYLFRPTNYTHLPQGVRSGEAPAVATLSMDASRRLMIAPLNGTPICSEPPPDAATSILAKSALEGAAKPTAGGEISAKAADEFAATAALIATRTAAVEFWRTTSFAYCQFRLNGWHQEANAYLQTAERIAPLFATNEKPTAP